MSALEIVGLVSGTVVTLLAIAAVGGAMYARWRSGGEDERFQRYSNAIEALEGEVNARKLTNERHEDRITAQQKLIDQQATQIKMLQTMVQGTEAIAGMNALMVTRFDLVDEGIRQVISLRGGTRSGDVGERPSI